MTNEELKACPFCGGKRLMVDQTVRDGYAAYLYVNDPDAIAYDVRCLSCAATGGWARSEAVARRHWNTRSTEDALLAEVELLRTTYAVFEELAPPDIPRKRFAEMCFAAWERVTDGDDER